MIEHDLLRYRPEKHQILEHLSEIEPQDIFFENNPVHQDVVVGVGEGLLATVHDVVHEITELE